MKKETPRRLFIIISILALATIIYFIGQQNAKLTGKAIYGLPDSFNCSNESINQVWNSLFKTSFTGIKILKNNTNCNEYQAYNNQSGNFYYLKRTFQNLTWKYNELIFALNLNMTQEGVNKVISNLSLLLEDNIDEYIVKRNISNSQEAISRFNSIFKVIPSDFILLNQENQSYYTFTEISSNNKSEIMSSILLHANLSYSYFVFSNDTLLDLNCTQNIINLNSSCTINETMTSYFVDSNNCGKKLDEKLYGNKTHYCDYDGNGLIGKPDSIRTNLENLSLKIGGSSNLSINYSGNNSIIEIFEENYTLIKFSYNFSKPLNLLNINLRKSSSSSSTSYLLINGLPYNKTLFLWRKNYSTDQVCIKNSEISRIDLISSNCNQSDEFVLNCTSSNLNYTCTLENDKYIIHGLSNSAVMEFSPKINNSILCSSNIICSDWGECSSNIQTRYCMDINKCNVSAEYYENASCISPVSIVPFECIPDWQCGNWSVCNKNSTRVRSCSDINRCGFIINNSMILEKCEYSAMDLRKLLLNTATIILIIIVSITVIYFSSKILLKKSQLPPIGKIMSEQKR